MKKSVVDQIKITGSELLNFVLEDEERCGHSITINTDRIIAIVEENPASTTFFAFQNQISGSELTKTTANCLNTFRAIPLNI